MRFSSFLSAFNQQRILGGAIVLAVTQIGASLMGLLRDRILAGTFPGLSVVDIYIASFRPSDLLFQVTIMAGFSVALVPLLSGYRSKGKQKEMGELLSGVTTVAAVFFGAVALLLSLVLPFVAPFLVQFEGGDLDFYIRFGRIALLTNTLFVFGNAFGHYLISIQKYWIYGVTPIIYTTGTILGTIFLTPIYGPFGPIYGTLLGAVVYVLLRLVAVVFSGCSVGIRFWHADFPEVFRLMLPRMIALGAIQLELLLFDTIASGLGAGAITINAYARNVQAACVGLAGVALAQSCYALMSQSVSQAQWKRFWTYLRRGILLLLFLTIPGSVLLVFLTPVAASLLNLQHALPVFAAVLFFYAFSIPFESMNHLLLRAFYATRHTITPAILSVANGSIAILVAWFCIPRFGVAALPIGFASGQIVQLIGLGVMLPRRVKRMKSS